MDGGERGLRPGSWAQLHGELIEEKSQHKRLTGHIQGERGEPGWCGIPEAERGLQKEVPSYHCHCCEGVGRCPLHLTTWRPWGWAERNCCEGVDRIQFKVG